MAGFLKGFRVLDLAEGGTMLCGRILADLGADVVKVEPPEGSPSRKYGPFYHNVPDPEKSLFWFAYNYNKRGITLDLESRDGRRIFKSLAKSAHFVIESFTPGYLDSLGVGYDDLSEINQKSVLVSITGFGQTGPYARFKAPDLVAMAMGGFTYIAGDPDRPPVSISFHHQAALHAGAEGAVGGLLAHYHRQNTGQGQHVDVSAQQSALWTLTAPAPHWDIARFNARRTGSGFISPRTGAFSRYVWPCKDGYVSFEIRLAALTGAGLESLFDWMAEEGKLDANLRKISASRDAVDLDSMSKESLGRLTSGIGSFFLTHTKGELSRQAQVRDIMLYPVETLADVCQDSQLKSRRFFKSVKHPELGVSLSYPGAFARISPQGMRIRRRAPLIGQHNREIYQRELGLSKEDLAFLKQKRVI